MSDREKELKAELKDIRRFDDDTDDGVAEPSARYEISSSGADFDVEGLVRRLDRDEIFIPRFQRNFVWKMPESSRLIESLLLGLPVPGIFLALEPGTNRLLVIDGQQRLKTLQYFFEGHFVSRGGDGKKRVFKLQNVQSNFEGKTINNLDPRDRRKLENTLIHATIVRQDSPSDNDSSIYHIFERLNSGGRKLQPQEIRSAVSHGRLIDVLHELNKLSSWREICGPISERMKDQELILRFLAMVDGYEKFESPMKGFLDDFTRKHREAKNPTLKQNIEYFKQCCDLLHEAIDKPFRRTASSTAVNAALYDSCMVALARKIDRDGKLPRGYVKKKYNKLVSNTEFDQSISQSTGNKAAVLKRMKIAERTFS